MPPRTLPPVHSTTLHLSLSNHFILLYSKCGCLTADHHVLNQTQCPNVFPFNILISACAKESCLNIAHQLFDQIPQPDLISYNTLISAYAVFGETEQALLLFNDKRDHSNNFMLV
ncbi:hypothetical protein Dsin_003678 [Dipteronia sinensis]|uniref:Pentatricopeptide repeat-containing protein n=1 Tax=Dipteronia sinensis TaxID=43782 RepID=A0AAE0B8H8_9ROSI|nr:hypothetical protein Dsin_003678 [Dipteronia sinensis]